MTTPRAARDRRTLRLGLATVAIIVVAGRAVPAWADWVAAERASAAELEAEQAAANTAVRALPALRDSARVRAARASAVLASALHAPTPAAAGAMFAEHVGEVAGSADVRLGALAIDAGGTPSHPCPSTARGVCLHRIRIRTELTGDVRGIAVFLASLERGHVPVTVPQLALAPSEPGAPDGRAEVLRGTVTLEALAVEDVRPTRMSAGPPGVTP